MKYNFTNNSTKGQLILLQNEEDIRSNYFEESKDFTFHTIAWNRGENQIVTIDQVEYVFEKNAILPLMLNQTYSFEKSEAIVAWKFNREFYCILNHDAEVGCVGFLFFGPISTMFIKISSEYEVRLNQLREIFIEEFESADSIQGDMLRMLLVRLIIKLTRLAKIQFIEKDIVNEKQFNIIRQYNVLVEFHFRKEHQVKFYAEQLNKSPKTISNIFSMYSKKSPLNIIHDRIITEAKRLFYYTDKSVKEISVELGFEDSAHFSKFFKNYTSQSPTELKKATSDSI